MLDDVIIKLQIKQQVGLFSSNIDSRYRSNITKYQIASDFVFNL